MCSERQRTMTQTISFGFVRRQLQLKVSIEGLCLSRWIYKVVEYSTAVDAKKVSSLCCKAEQTK